MKIGIIREGKIPPDRRTPFTPKQCRKIREKYPTAQIIIQSGTSRTYMDEEYDNRCFIVKDSVKDCDILFGIKEPLVNKLLPLKTYFIFSHTTKKQAYNKQLLKEILEKKITLVDYELLVDGSGNRLVGFGRFAGLVGAYNGIRAFAIRNNLPEPKAAHTLVGLKEMKSEATKFKLPPVRIAFTGGGRVAGGVKELLVNMGVKEVNIEAYLENETYNQAVFVQLEPGAYNKHKEGKEFELEHFIKYPEQYKSNFMRFADKTDMLISSAYWDPKAPKLFTREEMSSANFSIKVIADITCDIKGSIPSTLRASTIADPFYGYNPKTDKEELAFINPNNVTIMAVDNLPNELPRDASKAFGKSLIENVLPSVVEGDKDGILERATIAKDGKLTDKYSYLHDWVFS